MDYGIMRGLLSEMSENMKNKILVRRLVGPTFQQYDKGSTSAIGDNTTCSVSRQKKAHHLLSSGRSAVLPAARRGDEGLRDGAVRRHRQGSG